MVNFREVWQEWFVKNFKLMGKCDRDYRMDDKNLNMALCRFVKGVRKPACDEEYAPEEVFRMVLDFQKSLKEDKCFVDIFTNPVYESFSDCLDEVLQKSIALHNNPRKFC